MDAFYASVEQRDRPELRGRPVVVGGDPNGRGVVAAASYEARSYGVRSAIPCAQARRLCPQAVFVTPRIAHYRAVSRDLFELFREVTPRVEGLSLDEAYLDVTENTLGLPWARDVARVLKDRIKNVLGLTASAGVGPNKLVAKIASDLRKPDGLVVVAPSQVSDFMARLPVTRLWGVGPSTARRLRAMGLVTCADVRLVDPALLERQLGSFGALIHRLAHGVDPRTVEPRRAPKSRGSERTFPRDIHDIELIERELTRQSFQVAASLARIEQPGRRITLKVRYADFTTVTRSQTLAIPTCDPEIIRSTAIGLLNASTQAGARPVRLVGVSVGALGQRDGPEQLWLHLSIEPNDEGAR